MHVAMRARRVTIVTVTCLLIGLFGAMAGAQAQPDIAVIVHPGVAVDNLTIADLRRILTGDREFWSGGERVAIFIRAPIARERDAAVRDVCQMTEAQFRQHWIAKVFRAETRTGPRIVYTNESTIEQVSQSPGAIGFVQGPVTSKNVKIVKIEGRLPGQSGYKLR
jgi:ABC-type phosphate transport system substrate-binding protein